MRLSDPVNVSSSAMKSTNNRQRRVAEWWRALRLAVLAIACCAGDQLAVSSARGRDPLRQPFASTSIWNMPIGTGAVFVKANLNPNPAGSIWSSMPGVDDEILILTPSAPLTQIYYSDAGWSGRNRCEATGAILRIVPIPSDYLVPHSSKNSPAVFLMPDGRTLVQTQPLARCASRSTATSHVTFTDVDLHGDGITGAHGGSGLSAIGGSIRLGELRPGSEIGPAHVLKVNVYAKEAMFKCTTRSECSRWPAVTSDSYAVGWYGSANNNPNSAMRMGSLLAIPGSIPIESLGLETIPARQLAWTLQNYGAYIVDDTYAPGFDFSAEIGPSGSKRDEFRNDWGFDMAQKLNMKTPWVRDMQRIVSALHVVDNNYQATIGGGGTPKRPLASPLRHPYD